MRTISGKVISSKPISLDRASKFLAKFVSAETEASQSNKAFLRRTSSAFSELNQQTKQLRPSKPDRKRKKQHEAVENDAVEVKKDVKNKEIVVGSKGSDLRVKNEINDSVRDNGVVKKEKKKKKREGEEESVEGKKEIGQSEKHGSKKKRIKSEKS